jgi:DNA processing protein
MGVKKMGSLTQLVKTTDSPSLVELTEDVEAYLTETSSSLIPLPFLAANLPDIEVQFPTLFYKGNLDLLLKPCVSIVGTRNPTAEGIARAKKVTRVLVDLGFIVVSGLAKGIDTVAHETALANDGFTVAVLGTPIHKIYPAENKRLAAKIEKSGIIISPSLPHEETGRYLFPRRNRLMALLSRATIIIEAGETSGVVHQASECLKQGRTLLLLKSLADNKNLTWPAGFIKSGAHVIESPDDLGKLLCK